MSFAKLRIRGWESGASKIWLITILRTYSGLGLREAKDFMDRFDASGEVELPLLDANKSKTMGEEMLERKLVQHAELIFQDQTSLTVDCPPPRPKAAVTVTSRPPREAHACPGCDQPLKNEFECLSCGWLRFPGDRSRWKEAGECPRCGFAYRWDGSNCAHCGYPSAK